MSILACIQPNQLFLLTRTSHIKLGVRIDAPLVSVISLRPFESASDILS
jgi:hypothetical protein